MSTENKQPSVVRRRVVLLVYDQTDGYGAQGGSDWGCYYLTEKDFQDWREYIEKSNGEECRCPDRFRELNEEDKKDEGKGTCDLLPKDMAWIKMLRSKDEAKVETRDGGNNVLCYAPDDTVLVTRIVRMSHYWRHDYETRPTSEQCDKT